MSVETKTTTDTPRAASPVGMASLVGDVVAHHPLCCSAMILPVLSIMVGIMEAMSDGTRNSVTNS